MAAVDQFAVRYNRWNDAHRGYSCSVWLRLVCSPGPLVCLYQDVTTWFTYHQNRILSASVRDNIIFSHEYDEDFYNLVLDACALGPDIRVLPQGDLTQVGEKGWRIPSLLPLRLAYGVILNAGITVGFRHPPLEYYLDPPRC
jgi:hypothetical protein